MSLPSELSPALSDGVVLCYLANHVKPRSVASIHVPSPAVVSIVIYVVLTTIKDTIYFIYFITFSLNLQWPDADEMLIIFWKHVVKLESMKYMLYTFNLFYTLVIFNLMFF